MSYQINIIAWNCRNASVAVSELNGLKTEADIVFLSETRLRSAQNIYFTDHTVVERLGYPSDTSPRPMRGIMLLTRRNFNRTLKVINASAKDSYILAQIDDTILIFVYLYPHQEFPDSLATITDFHNLTCSGSCAIFGDINLDSNRNQTKNRFSQFSKGLSLLGYMQYELPSNSITFCSLSDTSCIDRLFVSERLKVASRIISQKFQSSDHYPIIFSLVYNGHLQEARPSNHKKA